MRDLWACSLALIESSSTACTYGQWVGSERVCVFVWITFTKHGHSASEAHWNLLWYPHTHTHNTTYHTSAVLLSVTFCIPHTELKRVLFTLLLPARDGFSDFSERVQYTFTVYAKQTKILQISNVCSDIKSMHSTDCSYATYKAKWTALRCSSWSCFQT